MRARLKDISLVYLRPADLCLSVKPCIIETILGSCVSVTMWHMESRTGGMCHALLPVCRDKDHCTSPCKQCGRFVECAIKQLLKSFDLLNIKRSDIEVKIFGGAETMSYGLDAASHASVGKLNVLSALAIIESNRLKLKASDTGGSQGRKLFFHTGTGVVYLKRLSTKAMNPDCTIAERA